MPRRVVIIGAHAAGVDAASAARRTDRNAEITLITKQRQAGYSPCGIPFVIGRHIPSFEKLIARTMEIIIPGDVVLTLGAGNILQAGEKLLEMLQD